VVKSEFWAWLGLSSKAEPKSGRDVAGRHVSSSGETVTTSRHFSPETLKLSGLVSPGLARRGLMTGLDQKLFLVMF
ncbi:hypothetical protein A2U01_0071873, partial [Trifolium medium]|nr:hypothetical protein [Trifolium medium]